MKGYYTMAVSIRPMPPFYDVTIANEKYPAVVRFEEDNLQAPYQRILRRFSFHGLGDIAQLGETVTFCGDDYTIIKRDARPHICYVRATGVNLVLTTGANLTSTTVLLTIKKPKNVHGAAASNSFETHATNVTAVKQIVDRNEDETNSIVNKTSVAHFYIPYSIAVDLNQKWQVVESGRMWRIESINDLVEQDKFPYVTCSQLGYKSP